MSTQSGDWRIELINVHRDLFDPPPNAPVLAKRYLECGPGWRDLIERACSRIAAILGAEERVEISQIKEKYGTMRAYWRGKVSENSRQKVEEVLALAHARSAATCELCGENGRLYRAEAILMTRCHAHAKGQPVPNEPGLENVHIVYRQVEGRLRIACCRYDRATDTFMDIPPPKDLEE